MFSLPMDAGRDDLVTGRDELGRPVRRSMFGHEYGEAYAEDPAEDRRRMVAQALMEAAQRGEAFEPGLVGMGEGPGAGGVIGGLVQGAIEGFTAPGRAARGEPVTLGETWATALDYGLLGAPMEAPKGSLRAFASRDGGTLDDAVRFSQSPDAIFHSGHAPKWEEMHKWGVEPDHGPWVREVAAGAVDDVDEFLDATPMAAWWSDQPDWIKAKVSRATGKPVDALTIDDIREHGHLAIASADEYATDAYRIGPDGLFDGERTSVTTLGGEDVPFYSTSLYEHGDDGVGRYPFGIERNEIVTGEAIEPLFSLTGDELIEFLQKRGDLPAGSGGGLLGAQGSKPGIRAYHGSPHDFDRFSMDKIGTGEGAQAYGHGLYFAESEGVARSYRDGLVPPPPMDDVIGQAYALVQDMGGNRRLASETLRNTVDRGSPRYSFSQKMADAIESGEINNYTPASGRMYEVNINADPADFLDWDAPLSAQSPKVREALAAMDPDMYSPIGADFDPMEAGQMVYSRLQNDARGYGIDSGKVGMTTLPGAQSKATDDLRGFGIPGIKYLDAGSRGAGDGSRNFVVFDDNLIEIVRKYGVAGAAALTGMTIAEVENGLGQAQAGTNDEQAQAIQQYLQGAQ